MVVMVSGGTRRPLVIAYVGYITWTVTLATVWASQRNYTGSQVFRVEVPSLEHWSAFYEEMYREKGTSSGTGSEMMFDVWRHPTQNGSADIHIDGSDVITVRRLLQRLGLSYHVTVNDVGRLISEENASNRLRRRRSTGKNDVIGHYARYNEIVAWMKDVTVRYPDIARMIDIGGTSGGRRMKVLKLGTEGRNKWKVWLDGGIHAREWIAPATLLYLADQLVRGYAEKDEVVTEFLRKVDWYFLPVANPDGYEYSHTHERMWRKNRKRDDVTGCHGVDLNRNWRFQWGGAYSSADPCDNVYRGAAPEDEQEVRNIVRFLSPRAHAFIAFLTYHSYGQRFITRWDYSKDIVPNDHDQLMSLAMKAVREMHSVHGTVYDAGRAPELMYPYGGGSPDWARAVANVKYSYLIELRDKHSFILPPEEIVPTGQENWAAMRAIAREILHYYGDILAPHEDDPPYWSHDNHVTYEIHKEIHKEKKYDQAPVFHANKAASAHRQWLHVLLVTLCAFIQLV